MTQLLKNLLINTSLLLSGFAATYSGLLIQVQYHIGNNGSETTDKLSLGLDYITWANIHKASIVVLLVLAAIHVYLHIKWYQTVIRKNLLNKNKQVLLLSTIFIISAITGMIPWVIDAIDGNQEMRITFIEIHDKISILLSIYFISHVTKRMKWFKKAFLKVRNGE